MIGMAGVCACGIAHRGLLPAFRDRAGRILPDATAASTSVSHAEDSTIGSNFCQDRDLKKMQNEECKMQKRGTGMVNFEW
jgi:hypothetical protein